MKNILLFIVGLLIAEFSNAQSYNFQQAMDAMKEKDYEKSLEYLSRDLKDNPKSALSFYYRAVIYNYQEQNATALSDINNSIKYFSTKEKEMLAGAHRLRGHIYLKIEEYAKSLDDFSIAIKLLPNEPDIYIDRAQVYFDTKQFEKAEIDYRQVLKIDEGEVRAWAGLGRNYLQQKNYVEAENILNKLVKLSSDYPTGYYYRAIVYFEQDKFDEAINDIFQCFLLDESDKQVRSLFLEYSEKNYPLSFSKVNRQISAHPEKDLWYFIRAQLNEQKFNLTAAISDYTKVIELSDINYKSDLLAYRAKCFSNAGMYEQAIKDFTESLSIDSLNAYNYGYRGDAKRLMGNYKGSIDDFGKAIELEPRESWFYYRRGWTREFLKDFENALTDYNEAISIDGKYVYSYLNRGRLYETHLNNIIKAKQDYQKILSLDTVLDGSGNCRQYALFHLGKNEEAISWLNKIIERYPSDGNYYDAACLYSLMNKQSEAIANLKIAFQKGYRDFVHISVDDDLDNIRNSTEFKNLVQEWKNTFNESLKTDLSEPSTEPNNETESVSIPMKSKGSGVYEVSSKINELSLNLIFDTGASDISISQTEVQFMLKNGYLSSNDIMGSQSYMDANGDIEIGTKILLRKVDFGGLILKNISASVVHNKNAPLLFGQSALSKYGKIIIDNDKKIITITKTGKSVK